MEWIDAKIALPSNERCVLVVSRKYSDEEVFIAYFKEGKWYDPSIDYDPIFNEGADYWMDYPKPPKK